MKPKLRHGRVDRCPIALQCTITQEPIYALDAVAHRDRGAWGASVRGVEGAGKIRQCVAAGAERGTYYVAQAFEASFMDMWATFAQHVLYDGDRNIAMVIACMVVSPEMSGDTKVTRNVDANPLIRNHYSWGNLRA